MVTAGGSLVATRTIKRTPQIWDKSLHDVLWQHTLCFPGLTSGALIFNRPGSRPVQEVEVCMPVHEDGVLLRDNLQPLKEQKEQDEAASDPPSSPREISETLRDPKGGTGDVAKLKWLRRPSQSRGSNFGRGETKQGSQG